MIESEEDSLTVKKDKHIITQIGISGGMKRSWYTLYLSLSIYTYISIYTHTVGQYKVIVVSMGNGVYSCILVLLIFALFSIQREIFANKMIQYIIFASEQSILEERAHMK